MLRSTAATCGWLLLCGASSLGIAATVQYRLTDLGDLTSDRMHGATLPTAIGDKAEIVGQSFNNALQARAFLWTDGHMLDLGNLSPLLSGLEAFALNKKPQIVGGGLSSSGQARAFLWERNRMTDLGTLHSSGASIYAWSINGKGDIVGAGYTAANELHAVRWIKGVPKELGALPDGRVAVQAFGINDQGEIVGYLSPGGTVSFAHAFIWKNGKFTDLGTLPRTNLSFANALNEHGQVVGQSYNTVVPGTSRAFLWEDGGMIDLGMPAPAHRHSEARAINKKGTVVGTSGIGSVSVAWVWRDGVVRDLNKLIASSDPNRTFVTLTEASGVNDKEEIVAQGVDRRSKSAVRGYLLTPVGKN